MATPNYMWTGRQTLNMPTANPNQGLQVASTAANNLVKQAQAAEEAKATAAYRQGILSQADRRQDYIEGEGARNIAEEQRKLGLATERGIFANSAADGAAFSGAEAFKGLDAEAARMADARYNDLTPDQQHDVTERFTMEQGRNLTQPSDFARNFRDQLTRSGKFTEAQIKTRVSDRLNEIYPTLDPDIAKAMLIKPGSGNTTNVNVNGGGGVRGGASVSPLVGQGTIQSGPEALEQFFQTYDIKGEEGLKDPFFGKEISDLFPWFDRKADRQKMMKVRSQLKAAGLSDQAIAGGVFPMLMKSGGEIDGSIDPNGLTVEQIELYKGYGADFQAQDERLIDRKSGMVGNSGDAFGANGLAANNAHNNAVLAQLSRSSPSISELNTTLLDSLGPRPGTPGSIDPVAERGLESLLQNELDAEAAAAAGQAAPLPAQPSVGGSLLTPPEILAQNGGQPRAQPELSELLINDNQGNAITPDNAGAVLADQVRQQNAPDFRNPLERILATDGFGEADPNDFSDQQQVQRVAALNNKIFKTESDTKPLHKTEQSQKLSRMQDFSGTGINQRKFEQALSFKQKEAYKFAKLPTTSQEDATQIMWALRDGRTPNINKKHKRDPLSTDSLLDTAANIDSNGRRSTASSSILPAPRDVGGPQFDEQIANQMNASAISQVERDTQRALVAGASIADINALRARGGLPPIKADAAEAFDLLDNGT